MSVLDSLVVRISACHVEGPGSIPGRGVFFLEFYAKIIMPRPLFLFTVLLYKKVNYQFWAGLNVYGHIMLKAPVLVRSLKLSNIELC